MYHCFNCSSRSKKRKRRKERSPEEEEESDGDEGSGGEEEGSGEEMWVEKKLKRDKDDAFVGPVPDLKVQASVAKKE